jgi:hypothetical protein
MKNEIIKKGENKLITKKNIGSELVKRIEKQEDMANAVIHASHQFYLLIQSILKEKYGFDDKHLRDLNKEVTRAVEGLAWFEEKGLNPLSAHSIDQLVDVTLNHYAMLKAARAGILLPTNKEAAKVLMGKKK